MSTNDTATETATTEETPVEAPETAAAPEAPEVTPDAPEAAETQDGDDTDKGNPNREAAKRRSQLREVEAERDGLRGQLEAAHRQLIEQHVSSRLVDAGDYWRYGDGTVPMADDGVTLDAQAIEQHVQSILTARPHLAKRGIPAPNPAQGSSSNGVPRVSELTWSEALGGK